MKRKLLLTGVILLIMGLTFVACLNDDGGGHVYVPVTGVTIDQGTALSIGVGATPTLTATVAPGHASNKALTWTSSNPDVVRVITPLSGVIEAMGQGQATITATSHANRSIFGTIIITVGPAVIPTGVTVNPAILRLNLQGTKTFTLTAAVAPDNATVKTVKWSSSNPEFATVHEDTGLVTAVAAGVAVITATTVSGNRTNTSTVTVIDVPDIPVISLTVAPKTLELRPGESSSDLEAIINPFDATIQDVIWTSDNTSIVTVDAATGEVRAVAPGQAVITAVSVANSSAYDTAAVTVKRPVTGISLNISEATLNLAYNEDKTVQLTVTVDPTDATNQGITWSTSAAGTADVDQNGLVTAVAVGGPVIITATSDDDPTVKATAAITVINRAIESVSIPDIFRLYWGGTQSGTITATVLPDRAPDKRVTWSIDNSTVATVDANTGLVTAVGPGRATITATTVVDNQTDTGLVLVTPLAAMYQGISRFLTAAKNYFIPSDLPHTDHTYFFGSCPLAIGDYFHPTINTHLNNRTRTFTIGGLEVGSPEDPENPDGPRVTPANHDNYFIRFTEYDWNRFGRAGPGNLTPIFDINNTTADNEDVANFPWSTMHTRWANGNPAGANPFRMNSRSTPGSTAHFAFTGYRQHVGNDTPSWQSHSSWASSWNAADGARVGTVWVTGGSIAADTNAVRFNGVAVDLGEEQYIDTVVLYAMRFGCNETGSLQGLFNDGSTTVNNIRTIFVEYSTDINAFSGLTSDGRPYTASAADAARWVRRNVWNWQPGAAGAWINNVWQEFGQIDMTPTEHNVFVFHLETPVRARFVRALFEQLPNPVGSTTNFQGSVWLNSFEVYNTRPDFSSGQ